MQHMIPTNSDSRAWWKFVNKFSGKQHHSSTIHLEKDDVLLSENELASVLTSFFSKVNEDISPLDLCSLPT